MSDKLYYLLNTHSICKFHMVYYMGEQRFRNSQLDHSATGCSGSTGSDEGCGVRHVFYQKMSNVVREMTKNMSIVTLKYFLCRR